MKNKILLILILFFCFCFIIFFKSLKIPKEYIPESTLYRDLIVFESKDLFSETEISFDEIFINNEFYILNIWASWCLPCRNEHKYLIELSKNKSSRIIV